METLLLRRNIVADVVHPKKPSFDCGNKEKHNNRILLEAEPQIGKTGVYLSVSEFWNCLLHSVEFVLIRLLVMVVNYSATFLFSECMIIRN